MPDLAWWSRRQFGLALCGLPLTSFARLDEELRSMS